MANRLTDMQKRVAMSGKETHDADMGFLKMSKRAGLRKRGALTLKSQLRKMKEARDAGLSGFDDGRVGEV